MKMRILYILIIFTTIGCSKDPFEKTDTYQIKNSTDTAVSIEFGPKIGINKTKFNIEKGEIVDVTSKTSFVGSITPSAYDYVYVSYKKYIFKDTIPPYNPYIGITLLNSSLYKKCSEVTDKNGNIFCCYLFIIDEAFINKKIEEQNKN